MADPLHCAVCQAPATVHLTQIAHGKITKVHLCESCATQGGATEPQMLKLSEIFALVNPAAKETETTGGPGATCPECGLTEADFRKTARFGCAHCYDLFSDNLAALLPRIQPGRTHTGKHPEGARIHAARTELSRRRDELKSAVKAENYEVAASVRDAIRALETEITALEQSA